MCCHHMIQIGYIIYFNLCFKIYLFAWCTYCNDPSGNDRKQAEERDGTTSEHMMTGPKRC
jgi:hypothetical protein